MAPALTVNPVENPWQAALDGLEPDLKSSLVSVQGDELDVLTAVLDEAVRRRKLCLEKRWRINFHGKVIIFRDVFDKIIAWVQQFAAVADVAVQFDPTAASLPWAGVRFLLQVSALPFSVEYLADKTAGRPNRTSWLRVHDPGTRGCGTRHHPVRRRRGTLPPDHLRHPRRTASQTVKSIQPRSSLFSKGRQIL